MTPPRAESSPPAASQVVVEPQADDAPTAPAGMVYVPGGVVEVGANDGLPHERPVFRADVTPFFMDRAPVTVAAFRTFVQETGFVTEAERFGNAGVLVWTTRMWQLVDGANWQHPLGPEAAAAPDDHPVTQVSWNDAEAFCTAQGGRLPTEVEWEHAARGGVNSRSPYPWGDALVQGDAYQANTWQGTFPLRNTEADRFRYTSPVGTFPETVLGLQDMGGNVWEWTADWYRPYSQRNQPFTPTAASEKALRGGSFLCEPGWCHGYRVSGRSNATPETSLFHTGFRCVQDVR